jgi:hypothetical protein
MATYTVKLTDSFITKLQIFLFTKAFDEHILDYIQDKEQVKNDFKNFELTLEIAKVYSSQYYQFEEDKYIKLNSNKKIKSKELVDNLMTGTRYIISNEKILKNYLNKLYDELKNSYIFMTTEEFNSLINEKTCAYCGISVKQISELGANGKLNNKRSDTRGYTLEIDRKEPNLEYTKDNCCMTCYWCNNAKTDEFDHLEFKEIARGINSVWKSRGVDIVDFNNITFWQ